VSIRLKKKREECNITSRCRDARPAVPEAVHFVQFSRSSATLIFLCLSSAASFFVFHRHQLPSRLSPLFPFSFKMPFPNLRPSPFWSCFISAPVLVPRAHHLCSERDAFQPRTTCPPLAFCPRPSFSLRFTFYTRLLSYFFDSVRYRVRLYLNGVEFRE